MPSDATYLTENDGDDGEGPLLPVQTSLPEGIANSREPIIQPQSRESQRAQDEQPFNIIETDDSLNPIDGQRESEPRLNEIDAGPRSLVERQAAEREANNRRGRWPDRTPAERRAAAREGRDKTLQELRRLEQANQELLAWKEQVEPQLAGIQPRLNEIDQARVADQLAGLDRGIQEQTARAAAARRQISEAMISQDGEALNNALEQRDDAVMQTQRLTVQRNMLATGDPLGRTDQGQRQGDPRAQQRQQQQPQPQAPRPLPARAQALADDFRARHSWLDNRSAGDANWELERDFAIRLDAQIAREGYDPSGLEYWEVLEDRMRQYMPGRFDEPPPRQRSQNGNGNGNGAEPRRQAAPQPERRGPMVSGSGGGGAQRSGNDVYLSPGRKEALMQAGALGRDGRTVEDPTKFKRLLKSFQDYDRANGTVRQ